MISSNNAGWRLVYDGKQLLLVDRFDAGSTTESMFTIEEFDTKIEVEERIEELGLETL